MLTRLVLTFAMASATCVAQAQGSSANKAPLGRATEVQGESAFVDAKGAASKVLPNNPVLDRNRYITGANGLLTLKMDKGCQVVLKQNQTFLVEEEKVCASACHMQALDTTPSSAVLGRAAEVKGLVTVSDAKGVTRVLLNDAVIDRSRYVTSSTGEATLKMQKGCDIVLKPNQALTVDHERSCECLLALIENVGDRAGALLAGGGGAPFVVGGAILLLLGGGSAGPAAVIGGGGSVPVPDPGSPGGGGSGGGGGVIPNPPISNQ